MAPPQDCLQDPKARSVPVSLGETLLSDESQVAALINLVKGIPEAAFLAVHYDRLADALYSQYQWTGEPADLRASIMASNEAVVVGLASTVAPPPGHSNAAQWWALQGARLDIRYDRFGISTDLDNSIVAYETAIQSTDTKSAFRPILLLNQANALCKRYEAFGSPQDINEAIEKAEQTLAVRPEHSTTIQNDLSTMHLSKYEREGDLDALKSAVRLAQEAVESSREDDTRLTTRLLNLASALMAQYEHNNKLAVIEQAILASSKAKERSGYGGAIDVLQPLLRLARAHYLKYTSTKERGDLHASKQAAESAIHCIFSAGRTGNYAATRDMLLDLLQKCEHEEMTMEHH